MNYEPIELYLQDYINIVCVFQNELLPNLEEAKGIVGYRQFRKYKPPRSVISYNNLLKSLLCRTIDYYRISKSAIYLLDKTIAHYQFLQARCPDDARGFSHSQRILELKKYPNRIMLPGYVVEGDDLQNARKNLIQIFSVDEHFRLIYEPEIIRKNFFVVFRQIM